MPTQELKAPLRAFRRLYDDHMRVLAMAEEADAGFDAGEFSAGYHARLQEELFERSVTQVAQRFNVDAEALAYAANWCETEEQRYWFDAYQRRTNG